MSSVEQRRPAAAGSKPITLNGAGDTAPTRRPALTESTCDVVLIDPRTLIRECMAEALSSSHGIRMQAFACLDDWERAAGEVNPALVLLCVSAVTEHDELLLALPRLARRGAAFAVVAESDATENIIWALEYGARGYIPTNLPLAVAAQALRLVTEGGIFIPASSLVSTQRHVQTGKPPAAATLEQFTSRQTAVIKAICRGRSNKLIAYDLNMCESTVKVHVRNIMRKLKAHNRTEVAIMFQAAFDDGPARPATGEVTAFPRARQAAANGRRIEPS